MFVTYEQLFVFALYFAFGYAFGVIYGLLTFPFEYFKSVVFKALVSVILCLLFNILLFCVFVRAGFPNFRLYMPISVIFGFFAERKTLHTVLALFYEKLYNIFARKKVKR